MDKNELEQKAIDFARIEKNARSYFYESGLIEGYIEGYLKATIENNISKCTCTPDKTTGWTTFKLCNICGKEVTK